MGLTQEKLIKFLVQSIYLIYIKLVINARPYLNKANVRITKQRL